MSNPFENKFTRRNRNRFAHCVRHDGETEVINGQAMTPSQMFDMAQKGLPITTQNLGVTYDEGYSNLDFNPPLEYRRGVDIGDLYEARMDAKVKLRGLRDRGQFVRTQQNEGAE